ncbi:MAG: alpha-amylase/alpha-mannosidase [Planctomycetes bacterium]|nr:alpha-amylase/alpha-mannosidase [Planctomycetota bacterium]
MNKVHLAMLWHQHQPYYKDLVTGKMLMPWVRLHGIKDYIGMIDILDEFPDLRQTFNLVPSLMDQLDSYVSGECTDVHLEHSRKAPGDLDEDEVRFILNNFFMTNWRTMVRSKPRYGELLALRNFERQSIGMAVKRFSLQDIRDLQVWANLAWFHPLVIDREELLRQMIDKGKDYTEEDKHAVLDKQFEILAQVIPRHKQLQDDGRIEISTTPYYHPILPLLCDMRSAHAALPGMRLPEARADLKNDARRQLQMAADYYRRKFGAQPRGLWPSEGSVSPDMLPLAAEAGFTWMATDEEILARSLNVNLTRDSHQRINRPDVLYQPYRAEAGPHSMNMIFRDHFLSDLVGFKYQWTSAEDAANDFLTRLWHIRQSSPSRDHLVAVILDGENAWEHYPNSGVDFLRALYRRICCEGWIDTVRVGDYLEQHPPSTTLGKLFPGSWISHNFATWVGHPEKNTGWEYLHHTRAFLTTMKDGTDPVRKAAIEKAWEEIYIAEGSDWFWWYGDDHFSGNDEAFDELFRKHLKNVHTLLGHEPPQFLNNMIIKVDRTGLFTLPRAFLQVTVNGTQTSYFEWAAAGHYDSRRDQGAMHRVSDIIVSDIYFGFDPTTLFMRFDPGMEAVDGEAHPLEIRICFLKNRQTNLFLHISNLALGFPKMTLNGEGLEEPIMLKSVAFKRILELSCPFELLGYKEGDEVEFFAEIKRNDETVQRAPENTIITFSVPSKDFERVMWQV